MGHQADTHFPVLAFGFPILLRLRLLRLLLLRLLRLRQAHGQA
jgi:hypothetical protein